MPHETPAVMPSRPLRYLTVHVQAASLRYAMLGGRRHAVATVVPIIAGVLNDYLVPREELAAFVEAWNGIPLPVGHPQNSYGEYISANSPEMLDASIGRFFHARMDGDRLVGEVWLDIDKCTALGGLAAECLTRLETGDPLEVSTGFYPETAQQSGVWNGVRFDGIHRHIRPDHLALLPQGVGACSLAMGCGVRALAGTAPCPCTSAEGAPSMEPLVDANVDKPPGKLRSALRTLFAYAQAPDESDPAVAEADATVSSPEDAPVVAEAPATAVSQAPPEPVPPPAAVMPHPDAPAPEKGYTMLNKSELIARLVAHEHTAWTEEQAPVLQTLEERMLEQLLSEADRRHEDAPLNLAALKKLLKDELDSRDRAFDAKLTNFAQQAEERAEREQIVHYLVTHQNWEEADASALPIQALRNIHRITDPVSYIGQGLPRLGQTSSMDDNLPADTPAWS